MTVLAAGQPTAGRGAEAAATRTSVGLVVATLLVQLLLPGGWGGTTWWPLVAGLLLGLPHGAVDHLVPRFRRGAEAPGLALVVIVYTAVAALAYAGFRAAPALALVVFVAVSAAHFGSGDVAFVDDRADSPGGHRTVRAAAHGGVVMLLPLVLAPATTATVVADLVPGTSGVLPPAVRAATAAGVAVAVVLALAVDARHERWQDAAELVLLLALVLVVPPFVAFGVYFGGWHSVRHLARVLREEPASADDLRQGRLGPALARFGRSAALPTLAALLALAVLWSSADGWAGFVASDLVVLAALTTPHVVMVAWLDHDRRTPATAPLRARGLQGAQLQISRARKGHRPS